jgi:hypothetical protein
MSAAAPRAHRRAYYRTWYLAHRAQRLAAMAARHAARGGRRRVRWTGPMILQAIQQFWAATGRWPGRADCTPAQGLPSGGTVARRFGSLVEARRQAGMPGGGLVRPRLSDEERRANYRRATARWKAAHPEQWRAIQRRAKARYRARQQGRRAAAQEGKHA